MSNSKVEILWNYFGNKKKVAPYIWNRIGNVDISFEPFCGTAAWTLLRPMSHFHKKTKIKEVINDKNGYVANFFRAVQNDPEKVAYYADSPTNEIELVARYKYLRRNKSTTVQLMKESPTWYCPKRAGWFAWGLCCWIGTSEFIHFSTNANNKMPELFSDKGILKQEKKTFSDNCMWTIDWKRHKVEKRLQILSNRLRYVTVACGDWKRIVNATLANRLYGIFLDPPYMGDYNPYNSSKIGKHKNQNIRDEILEWAPEYGQQKNVRIAIAGYADDGYGQLVKKHNWEVYAWSASGGYAVLGKGETKNNRHKERLYFSPYCLPAKRGLFNV